DREQGARARLDRARLHAVRLRQRVHQLFGLGQLGLLATVGQVRDQQLLGRGGAQRDRFWLPARRLEQALGRTLVDGVAVTRQLGGDRSQHVLGAWLGVVELDV